MNQIQLFNGNEQKIHQVQKSDKPKSPSKLQANRPHNLTVSKIFSDNQKWRECKIIGKNISIRSYSACCAFQEKFFVYGGYQILNGSLADFYQIDLNDNQPKFNWVQVLPSSSVTPGPRSKHALIGAKQKIYLIGGIHQDIRSSNDIFEWNPTTKLWTLLKPQGIQNLPKLDSFGCVLIQKQGEQTIYIIGGYNDQTAQMCNSIYEFNPTKNSISITYRNNSLDKQSMIPRLGLAAQTDGNNIYVFGGKSQHQRHNDLWMFNLQTLKYQRMPDNGHVPAIRNGHSMNYFNHRLYVFGGIHDITWELDDLHIYNLNKKQWTTLEQDSPRKIQKKASPQQHKGEHSAQKKTNKKKNWYQTVGSGLGPNKSSLSPPMSNTFFGNKNSISKQDEKIESPGKMIDQQRKKVFYLKKAQMLKNFEVQQKQKPKYILLQTSSQAMKNSLDVIGNPSKQSINEKLTDFGKETKSKFLAPLQNNSNLVIGKRPCARDGHCAVMIHQELVIFGGDRHQMSFNDIYKLNFALAQKEIDK